MPSIDLPPNRDSMLKMMVSTTTTKMRPHQSKDLLKDRVAIITGSNQGIGLACAHTLASLSLSHLIMGVRSVEKGEEAAKPIREAYPSTNIHIWDLDMLSYDSIENFAARCEKLPRLDIAILNAGTNKNESMINPSTQHEEVFQVNYLSTALLSLLLLPILKRSASTPGPASRLSIVGSGMGLKAAFPNRDARPLIPSFDQPWEGMLAASERYSVSKLLVLMLVLQLSTMVRAKDVIINVVEPGLVSGTSLNANAAPVQRYLLKGIHKIFARSPEEAAWTYVDAVAVKGDESHGSFLMDLEVVGFHEMMYTEQGKQTASRLWEETLQELEFAGVRRITENLRGNT